jgi:hypothetical protein
MYAVLFLDPRFILQTQFHLFETVLHAGVVLAGLELIAHVGVRAQDALRTQGFLLELFVALLVEGRVQL